jgi:acyl-coenzyme A thioesterase PaaI-like protein
MSESVDRFPNLREMEAVPLFRTLGFAFTGAGEGWAEVTFTESPETHNLYGIVHGGVWLFLADSAMGGALGTVVQPSERVLTAQSDFGCDRSRAGGSVLEERSSGAAGRSITAPSICSTPPAGRSARAAEHTWSSPPATSLTPIAFDPVAVGSSADVVPASDTRTNNRYVIVYRSVKERQRLRVLQPSAWILTPSPDCRQRTTTPSSGTSWPSVHCALPATSVVTTRGSA